MFATKYRIGKHVCREECKIGKNTKYPDNSIVVGKYCNQSIQRTEYNISRYPCKNCKERYKLGS